MSNMALIWDLLEMNQNPMMQLYYFLADSVSFIHLYSRLLTVGTLVLLQWVTIEQSFFELVLRPLNFK